MVLEKKCLQCTLSPHSSIKIAKNNTTKTVEMAYLHATMPGSEPHCYVSCAVKRNQHAKRGKVRKKAVRRTVSETAQPILYLKDCKKSSSFFYIQHIQTLKTRITRKTVT